jgi:hypothetical protein
MAGGVRLYVVRGEVSHRTRRQLCDMCMAARRSLPWLPASTCSCQGDAAADACSRLGCGCRIDGRGLAVCEWRAIAMPLSSTQAVALCSGVACRVRARHGCGFAATAGGCRVVHALACCNANSVPGCTLLLLQFCPKCTAHLKSAGGVHLPSCAWMSGYDLCGEASLTQARKPQLFVRYLVWLLLLHADRQAPVSFDAIFTGQTVLEFDQGASRAVAIAPRCILAGVHARLACAGRRTASCSGAGEPACCCLEGCSCTTAELRGNNNVRIRAAVAAYRHELESRVNGSMLRVVSVTWAWQSSSVVPRL